VEEGRRAPALLASGPADAPSAPTGRHAMLQGFKDFLMRGNLIELAVAFIMGTVFAAVVSSFTDIVLSLLGLIVDVQGFSDLVVYGIKVGPFVSALITFVLTAAVLYFLVVVPYNRVRARQAQDEAPPTVTSEDLLTEIRDLLQARGGRP
jgi:large conductance mechanosensitive channel